MCENKDDIIHDIHKKQHYFEFQQEKFVKYQLEKIDEPHKSKAKKLLRIDQEINPDATDKWQVIPTYNELVIGRINPRELSKLEMKNEFDTIIKEKNIEIEA